jgi:hypothetical protein
MHVRAALVLIVFPVLTLVISTLLFPVFLAFSPIVALFGSWAETLAEAMSIASLLCAVIGAAIITYRLWPGRDSSGIAPDAD